MKAISRMCVVASVLLGLLVAMPAQADEGDVIALIKLKGAMREAPGAMGLETLFGGAEPTNMFSLLRKLRQARQDNNLRAVIFDIERSSLGLAQIQELRAQFEALRAADKDVLIYCETLTNGTLLLGSAASRLVLMPTGVVVFNGLHAEGLYIKNLLDKIGVEADILHCGAYKSAGEPLYRTGPSPEAEEQTNRILDSIFEQMIEGVADSHRLSPERVAELIDTGIFTPAEALEAKLVDKLQYREDFIKSVKRRYGPDTKVVAKYGKKQGPDIDFGSPWAMFQLFGQLMKGKEKSQKEAIAVVYVEGLITSGTSESGPFGGAASNAGSATIRKAIAEAAQDESVQALILRVDSQGGSGIASDVICEATKRFKETGRPFVVSMGNVAGSGGYWVATLADTIFAEPGTLTGSIGVVGGKIVTKGLWDWVGVTSHEYKRGKFGDLGNTNRPFADEERTLIEGLLVHFYDEFKGRVQEGRGDRLEGDLEDLAGGRVYTGVQALEVGLVDELGGFADAIKFTESEAELGPDYELRVYPRPQTIVDVFAKAFGGQDDEDEFISMGGIGARFGPDYAGMPQLAGALEAVRRIDPIKATALQYLLTQVQLLSRENVLLVGPDCATLVRW